MRSGYWRGATHALGLGSTTAALGLALALTLTLSAGGPAHAQDFHTIPRLVPAVDVNTGGPYYAPPIPYGHYAGKNCLGKASGLVHGCLGKLHSCWICGGKGCRFCGGKGLHGGDLCGACGGKGCGLCGGRGVCGGGPFHHKGGGYCDGLDGCGTGGGGLFHHHKDGAIGTCSGGGCVGVASTVVAASAQGAPGPFPTAQCIDPGCSFVGKHRHRGCGLCGGHGCGGCVAYDPCGACGGKGCGLCGGKGKGHGLCKFCGGKGCGLCGKGHGLCKFCGGMGCNLCAHARGLVGHLLGRDRIDWFVGPGGPVPLTPGYTPYAVTTRSPRDFLAFPPFVP
jgi:hypothetical protein